MRTNVYGVVSLYQATRELLKTSVELGKEPTFVLMGSMAGVFAYVNLLLSFSFLYSPSYLFRYQYTAVLPPLHITHVSFYLLTPI